MNKADLTDRIITSSEARTFLSMVTKGFYSRSYVGLWIFEVIGREWDELREWAEGLKAEIHPQTCTWTIEIWEWVYGIEPDPKLDLEFRRQRILSKIRTVRPINPEALRRGIAALIGTGPEGVEVTDLTGPYRFEVVLHPGETPFYYNRIDRYIWETKPSHLAFETVVETKTMIRILIGTEWNLVGFGLTGQYNTGTRPGTAYRAKLYDSVIRVEPGGKGASIPERPAGSYFATGDGSQQQKMPVPSTVFLQSAALIDVPTDGAGYAMRNPMAQEKDSEAGRYPETSIRARLEDLMVSASADEKRAIIQHPKAGTVPETQIRLLQSGAEVHTQMQAAGYGISTEPTGTYPSQQIRAEKPIGGILPIITTDSYPIRYPLCGTGTTKSDS